MKFGENLKIIRKSKKMSQEELAEKLNVSRQSVSKWETGESYPEMNNILELCKIFNIKINDLIHTDMSDISSLDEEVIMNLVKFNEQKQKQVKSLSNVISLIGKIGSIVLKVCIPFIIIAMLLLPYIINNIEINNNEISFKTNNIKLIDDKNIMLNDTILIGIDEATSVDDIIQVLDNNSKTEVIIFIELAFVFLIIDLKLMIIILEFVEKLFNNIKNNNTPFIMDNVNYIKRIAYLLIGLIIIEPIPNIIINLLVHGSGEAHIGLIGIVEILIIFSMSYIFEYGYEIQKETKFKMYNE